MNGSTLVIRPAGWAGGRAGPSMYFCGDSGYFSGFADVGARYAPDVALLPIGGFLPASFRNRHMSPLDALFAQFRLFARFITWTSNLD